MLDTIILPLTFHAAPNTRTLLYAVTAVHYERVKGRRFQLAALVYKSSLSTVFKSSLRLCKACGLPGTGCRVLINNCQALVTDSRSSLEESEPPYAFQFFALVPVYNLNVSAQIVK